VDLGIAELIARKHIARAVRHLEVAVWTLHFGSTVLAASAPMKR
jgi:hypothetical protein